MIELLLFGVLGFLGLILLPLLLVGIVLRVVFGLIALPFKLVGTVAGAAAGVLGGLAKLAFGLIGLAFGLVALVGGLLLIPLIPILLIAGLIWLIVR